MITTSREELLAKMARIQFMEPGKLCVIRHGPQGPYYNLQCRHNGQTVTRYVPRVQAPLAQAHTANYERFVDLMQQYVQVVATQSREVREGSAQKKRSGRHRPDPKRRGEPVDRPLCRAAPRWDRNPTIGVSPARGDP